MNHHDTEGAESVNDATTASLLLRRGYADVFHVSPLAYLPWIAESGCLRSKASLRACGFQDRHFRSTTHRTDTRRGFDMVAHLFSRSPAPLLQSKLKLGIPHVELAIPSSALVGRTVLFCRYNIARHRVRVFTTSPRNGRMIGPYRVPVAATVQDQAAMLSCGVNNFEVLVADSLPLPDSVVVRTYSDRDASDVARLLRSADRKWAVQSGPRLPYPEVVGRIKETQSFIESAHANGSARHNVLEFDR